MSQMDTNTSLRHHHLFDSRIGESTRRFCGIIAIAPTATMADALSTAFACMPPEDVEKS